VVSLLDETKMDRTALLIVTTATPSDAKEYWRSKTMQERLAALELTRQVMNDYDPDTTRLQRVLEITTGP
jgi:hypothetical protein